MSALRFLTAIILFPGDQFCRMTGQNPKEDSGMLRGFVNNIAWGVVVVIVLAATV